MCNVTKTLEFLFLENVDISGIKIKKTEKETFEKN